MTRWLCVAMIAVLATGCGAKAGSQRSVSLPSDTGGSARGDLGPPQGEPIKAVLTSPPLVPPPVARNHPAKVVVELEVRELDLPIADGVTYTFWTFGGTSRGLRIVTMFYASCPMACPLLIETLRRIDRQLTPAQRAELEVLMITLDPENDSAEALKNLAHQRRIDTSRWTLARPAPGDVRMLSATLDIPYRRLADGSFSHASTLLLMDKDGRVLARSTKSGSPDPQFVAAIRNALSERRLSRGP